MNTGLPLCYDIKEIIMGTLFILALITFLSVVMFLGFRKLEKNDDE
jgi:hypothetical protein